MRADVAQQVTSGEELSVGDKIEAWHHGKLFHRGEVIRSIADTDLFWILDERTGIRRLIDAEVLVIRRVAVRAAGDHSTRTGRASGRPASEAPEPVVPASHVPLFQAPSLAG